MPQPQMNTNPFHIRNAETVIKTFVNTELNDIKTFTDEGEPIIEVDGEPLTRHHVDEALIHLTTEEHDEDIDQDHYVATVERILGETEITTQRPLAVSTDTDPYPVVEEYYESFWGSETEQVQFRDNAFERPDGGEIVRITNIRKIPKHEYETLTNHINRIPNRS